MYTCFFVPAAIVLYTYHLFGASLTSWTMTYLEAIYKDLLVTLNMKLHLFVTNVA